MQEMLEIERTFLVKKLPADLKRYKSKKIKQGFLSDAKTLLRLRQIGDEFEITKKGPVGNDIAVQNEVTISLTPEEFARLWGAVLKFVEKTRYYFPLPNGHTAEIDEYEGDLKGLFLIDVEFKSKEEMRTFAIPDWFGADVTLEDFSAGRFLAGKTFAEIKKLI